MHVMHPNKHLSIAVASAQKVSLAMYVSAIVLSFGKTLFIKHRIHRLLNESEVNLY